MLCWYEFSRIISCWFAIGEYIQLLEPLAIVTIAALSVPVCIVLGEVFHLSQVNHVVNAFYYQVSL